jgi:hypothetical protein
MSNPEIGLRKGARTLWAGHIAVWLLAGLSARLSRIGSQLEMHVRGLDGAELAPEHLRRILTAPTTEFKVIALLGVLGALVLAVALWRGSPKLLRRITLAIALVAVATYAAGYASR